MSADRLRRNQSRAIPQTQPKRIPTHAGTAQQGRPCDLHQRPVHRHSSLTPSRPAGPGFWIASFSWLSPMTSGARVCQPEQDCDRQVGCPIGVLQRASRHLGRQSLGKVLSCRKPIDTCVSMPSGRWAATRVYYRPCRLDGCPRHIQNNWQIREHIRFEWASPGNHRAPKQPGHGGCVTAQLVGSRPPALLGWSGACSANWQRFPCPDLISHHMMQLGIKRARPGTRRLLFWLETTHSGLEDVSNAAEIGRCSLHSGDSHRLLIGAGPTATV